MRFPQLCGREPTLDELAHEVGLPVAKAQMAIMARREPVSLETPAGEDGSARLVDFVADTEGDDALDSLMRKRFVEGTRDLLATLTARHAMPAISPWRAHVAAGCLMSYGASLLDSYRQTGVYAGRVLKGEKPADLPIMQAVKFEFVVNLKTAKTLGLAVPQSILLRADEVIE